MVNRRCRMLTLGPAGDRTAIATPAFASQGSRRQPVNRRRPAPTRPMSPRRRRPQQAQDGQVPDQTEIIVTAPSARRISRTSRSASGARHAAARPAEHLQLPGLYEQLPSVSYQTTQPGMTTVYIRGVSPPAARRGNHSGSLPQVGIYLDEQPVTTIGGTLDVHIYDVARIESLAGRRARSTAPRAKRARSASSPTSPSSGHLRPRRRRAQHGRPRRHRRQARRHDQPADRRQVAFRVVAWYQHDAGYIDNIFGSRHLLRSILDPTMPRISGITSTTRTSSRRISTTTTSTAAARRSRSTSTTIGRSRRRSCARNEGQRRLRLRSERSAT